MDNNTMPESSTKKMGFCHKTNFIINENVSQISYVTRVTDSIMDSRNEQVILRPRNDRPIRNVLSKQKTVKAKAVPEAPTDTLDMKEADTNDHTCCLIISFIPTAYTNRYADVYPYNDA